MHVAVDESRRERRALRIDDSCWLGGIDIFFFANGGDAASDGYDRVGIEDRLGEVSAEQQANVSDNELYIGR
jgi:hypothetical protein